MDVKVLLSYTKYEEIAIWKKFNRTLNAVDEDVEVIRVWLKMQPHIPIMLGKFSCFGFNLITLTEFQKM